ncbi:hypothetical protein BaRGS_00033368 [Batillaria attramentaria]|uniref:Uncharacterized protein n=1 Tax=Batillaria attramentaria TaxID=370345 RepID=A0ABD0JK99_9CAEN
MTNHSVRRERTRRQANPFGLDQTLQGVRSARTRALPIPHEQPGQLAGTWHLFTSGALSVFTKVPMCDRYRADNARFIRLACPRELCPLSVSTGEC